MLAKEGFLLRGLVFPSSRAYASTFREDNSTPATPLVQSDTLMRPLVRRKGGVLSNPRTEYRTVQKYQGRVKGVVLDWAGTVVDCGVHSPTRAFEEVFQREGVPITDEEAREPMGMHKKVHIRKITEMCSFRKRWQKVFQRYPEETDVERIYQNFNPSLLKYLEEHSTMIEGCVKTVCYLQQNMQIKVGSSTGYTSDIADVLKTVARRAGYIPDSIVAADEVPQARPYPYMVWMNAIRLDVNPIQAIVKVDDTADGVREGVLAGCWAVGIARTGNYVGLKEEDISMLDSADYERLLTRSYEKLSNAGAHYVIDTINDLPSCIDDINRRLASGESP